MHPELRAARKSIPMTRRPSDVDGTSTPGTRIRTRPSSSPSTTPTWLMPDFDTGYPADNSDVRVPEAMEEVEHPYTTGSRRTGTSRLVVSTSSKCAAVLSRLEQVPLPGEKLLDVWIGKLRAIYGNPNRILDVRALVSASQPSRSRELLDRTFLQPNIDAYAQLMPDFDTGRIRTSAPTIPTRSLRPTSIPDMLRTTLRCGCRRPLKRSSTPADRLDTCALLACVFHRLKVETPSECCPVRRILALASKSDLLNLSYPGKNISPFWTRGSAS